MRDISMLFHWDMGKLPFIWGPLLQPTNGEGIPDELTFELGLDNKTGLLIQIPNDVVSSALSFVYSKGSMITGMMENRGIGKQYADDFLKFIYDVMKTERMDGLKILEIGCGTGYLLYRLQQLGAECLGIEPGKHGQNGASQYSVQIVNDFFPSEKINSTFDLILSYTVLEHIENPFVFMNQLKSYTKPDGIIALGVPDCEPYIEAGDISFLLHEHWNYFTRQTLSNTLISIGASEMNIRKSEFGGALYASTKLTSDIAEPGSEAVSSEIEKALLFKERSKEITEKLSSFVRQIQNKEKTLAVYVPGRAVNALAISGVNLSHCRFFDDNSLLHGTYFPEISIPVEPRQNLINSPTDYVMIMSHSFGDRIAQELKSVLPSTTDIKTWTDLFL